MAKIHELNDNVLYYKKGGNKLQIPDPSLRNDIIERAHLLGHFQAETTYNRLKQKYYWKKMLEDIHQVVKACTTCKRYEQTRQFDHPAIVIPITGLFDRVRIDLVFGFKETDEGYRGLVIMTEYLSKYPYVSPIRTKSAGEIADKLFEYISFFGPPKELLSDQGKEFLNKMVENLSVKCGIERRVTASYHPQTNGLTEHFNATLVNSLRKHAEAEPDKWVDWLPFILLAYRTRVHSTTKQTPIVSIFSIFRIFMISILLCWKI